MDKLTIQCGFDDADSAELEEIGGNLYLAVEEGDEGGAIELTPETAEQLRDALTEWLEAQ